MNGHRIGQDIKYSLNVMFLPKHQAPLGVFFLNKGLRIVSHHLLLQRKCVRRHYYCATAHQHGWKSILQTEECNRFVMNFSFILVN